MLPRRRIGSLHGEPPGNVRRNANTARLAVPTGLPDSDAILLPQMDTWQRIAPNPVWVSPDRPQRLPTRTSSIRDQSTKRQGSKPSEPGRDGDALEDPALTDEAWHAAECPPHEHEATQHREAGCC